MWHPSANHSKSSLPSSSSLPFIIYFWLIFASIWAKPPTVLEWLAMCRELVCLPTFQDWNMHPEKWYLLPPTSLDGIPFTFRQGPLHFNGDLSLYMQHCLLWTTAKSSLPLSSSSYSSFTSGQYLLPSKLSHLWATHQLITIVHLSQSACQDPSLILHSIIFRDKVEAVGRAKTMKILVETRCHSETTKGANQQKLYLRHDSAQFYHFLDLYACI